jgi:hypothetical protein
MRETAAVAEAAVARLGERVARATAASPSAASSKVGEAAAVTTTTAVRGRGSAASLSERASVAPSCTFAAHRIAVRASISSESSASTAAAASSVVVMGKATRVAERTRTPLLPLTASHFCTN